MLTNSVSTTKLQMSKKFERIGSRYNIELPHTNVMDVLSRNLQSPESERNRVSNEHEIIRAVPRKIILN